MSISHALSDRHAVVDYGGVLPVHCAADFLNPVFQAKGLPQQFDWDYLGQAESEHADLPVAAAEAHVLVAQLLVLRTGSRAYDSQRSEVMSQKKIGGDTRKSFVLHLANHSQGGTLMVCRHIIICHIEIQQTGESEHLKAQSWKKHSHCFVLPCPLSNQQVPDDSSAPTPR